MIEAHTWTMTVRAHEPLALGYRRMLTDSVSRELLGETWAFTVTDSAGATVLLDGAPVSAASTIERDMAGDWALMAHPAGTSARLLDLVGLRWELAGLLTGGERDARYGGALVVLPAASPVAGTGRVTARDDVTMIIEREDA